MYAKLERDRSDPTEANGNYMAILSPSWRSIGLDLIVWDITDLHKFVKVI